MPFFFFIPALCLVLIKICKLLGREKMSGFCELVYFLSVGSDSWETCRDRKDSPPFMPLCVERWWLQPWTGPPHSLSAGLYHPPPHLLSPPVPYFYCNTFLKWSLGLVKWRVFSLKCFFILIHQFFWQVFFCLFVCFLILVSFVSTFWKHPEAWQLRECTRWFFFCFCFCFVFVWVEIQFEVQTTKKI